MSDRVRLDWRVLVSDIDCIGVRPGAIGYVRAYQEGERNIDRWTQLAPVAVQIRFFGGAEIWFEPHELRAATDIEAKDAERRLKRLRKRIQQS